MLDKLVALRERTIYHVAGTRPAAYYIADRDAGGVLVNAPPFDVSLLGALRALAPPAYIFLPSRRGARDLERWRAAAGVETIAFEAEAPHAAGEIDLAVDDARGPAHGAHPAALDPERELVPADPGDHLHHLGLAVHLAALHRLARVVRMLRGPAAQEIL